MRTIRNFELRIRRVALAEQRAPYGASICGPEHVEEIAQTLIGDSAQEHFCVFLLDVRNRVLGYSEVARGSIDACPVDPRTLFRAAIATGSSAIIVCHNHPSGSTEPSRADIQLTERLASAAHLLGLEFLDHVIVTDRATVSLRRLGLVPSAPHAS